ncbi:1-acyl-sn-glycerol-3-phosphate acyltransferase [Pelotomaculum isophthalicicum JI]|uniref:1-acyl-sn-glycerol-3-phosphate acyltransferase n=1 Tax=Pelotomaculum isophthalicicum JI TaxID=947010 RepID=A0A9X4GY28_9FIRM|nr:lysophospholipid acyltransferase family protein [Pelotomaculum isophthalicicum]MDF9407372.1 1-acyl-sn-glycerol-3-phosphate acyltransferase [Pelotomaculum isophthalicicum JI]
MVYILARFVCRIVLAVLRRWEIHGLSNLPAEGGLVLVSNHTSYWDPVIVGCAINRRINYMAKSELFDIPLLSTFIRAVGTFPVRRDQLDRTAIRTAMKLLEEGQIVGVFPEGTRSRTGELLKPHPGAAMLALKAGVPFLPVAIKGSRGFFGKVRVNIGKPVFYKTDAKTSRADMEKVSNSIMDQIAELLDKL